MRLASKNANPNLQAKSRNSAWRCGVGADWQLGARTAFRLEWERYSKVGERWGSIFGSNSTGEAKMGVAYGGVVAITEPSG